MKRLNLFIFAGLVLFGALLLAVLKKSAPRQSDAVPVIAADSAIIEPETQNIESPNETILATQRPLSTASVADVSQVLPDPKFEPADEYEKLLGRFNPRLMENPIMEDYIRDRLWLALDQLNNPLITSLELTPAQTEKLKSLIIDSLVMAADQASDALNEGATAAENEMQQRLAANHDNFDQQAAWIMGETRFTIYTTYREDYAGFNQIKFLGGKAAFTDTETESILEVVSNERRLVAAAVAELQNADVGNQSEEIKNLLNERVCQKLISVISVKQLTAFKELQAQSLHASRDSLLR